jgi:fluoroacetyl-CoA thioesterase
MENSDGPHKLRRACEVFELTRILVVLSPFLRRFVLVGLAKKILRLAFMARHIPIGARGEASETVELKHTLTAHHPDLPPVYSTPDMIRLMEIACFHALQPFCEEGEITVGIAINVEHRAASGIGVRVHADAVLEFFDGRFYSMRVSAHDGSQEIGRGTVGRAVVNVPTFLAKMRQKAEQHAGKTKVGGGRK